MYKIYMFKETGGEYTATFEGTDAVLAWFKGMELDDLHQALLRPSEVVLHNHRFALDVGPIEPKVKYVHVALKHLESGRYLDLMSVEEAKFKVGCSSGTIMTMLTYHMAAVERGGDIDKSAYRLYGYEILSYMA